MMRPSDSGTHPSVVNGAMDMDLFAQYLSLRSFLVRNSAVAQKSAFRAHNVLVQPLFEHLHWVEIRLKVR